MSDRIGEVLPLVIKPIRYTGGEYNALYKGLGASGVSWVLAMPDVYELGMSNYGLRILYSILNRQKDVFCDRCCCPWPDFGKELAARGLPLYALESKRPVKDFDIIGITLQSELCYTNLLYLLELSQIPLRRVERSAEDPLVVAGGPCTVNPLPVAAFVDAFVIGDGEEVVREISDAVKGWDRRNREDVLDQLSRLAGLYVPGKNGPERCRMSDVGYQNAEAEEQRTVKRRVVAQLREEDFPLPPVVPICEITHDRLTVEISRGCTRGCRFCQAGIINRPARFRPVEQILRLAERGIRASGWEEVSLLSLSALDYPDIYHLVRQLNLTMRNRRVSLSLPSTRGEEFSPELAFDLQEVKKAGLTFAPETASSRLRSVVNKNIPEVMIMESVRTALDAGWNGVKLYFMLGLPQETDADVAEIGRFVNEIARLCRGRAVRCSLSPFVPKPHTPLQWAGFEGVEPVRQKMDRLKSVLTRRNIKVKWENPESSFVQALLARGDETLSGVVERVYRQGGIFQEWSEYFRYESWMQACRDEGVNPEKFAGAQDPGSRLAWDFVDVGVSREFLKQEYDRSLRGQATPDCARAACSGCGACPDNQPPARPQKTPAAVAPSRRSWPGRFDELKIRFRLKYAVEEPYRYAAHLDRVRALYRALRRSELPIVYTKGFAPKPMVSLGPPLPVGLVSEGEYFDLFIGLQYSGDPMRDLAPFMPRGLRLECGCIIPRDRPTLGRIVNLARYRAIVPERLRPQVGELASRAKEIGGVRSVAVKPEGSIVLDLAVAAGVRLFTVLGRLCGLEENEVRSLDVVRLDCLVEKKDKIVTPMEGV